MVSPKVQTEMQRTRGGQRPSHSYTAPALASLCVFFLLHKPPCLLLEKAGAQGQGSNTFGGKATVPPTPLGVVCKKVDSS